MASVAAFAVAGGGTALAAPGQGALQPSEDGKFLAGTPAETLGYQEAQEYWTPERVAAAEPRDLPTSGVSSAGGAQTLSGADLFDSTVVADPVRYPNRVHGLLLGQVPGGTFSCSATLVTSGSGSLITTAGHCLVEGGVVSSNMVFIPAASAFSAPYAVWPVIGYVTTSRWAKLEDFSYDFAMMRLFPGNGRGLQNVIGSRGIGFNQPVKQRVGAYGYPARGPDDRYDGTHLVRCNSGYVPEPHAKHSRGLRCDMQQGASGGGIVAQHSFVTSVISHGLGTPGGGIKPGRLYAPLFGRVAKGMYNLNAPKIGWPSIGPIGCQGKEADIVGTLRGDKIKGTGGADVIATLGGNDRIDGGGGRDIICAGEGSDRVTGGGGKDVIEGGDGFDHCNGAKGNDKLLNCEKRRRTRSVA